MPKKIIVLPDHVASQIAAGEVVERPSSVVKELVENSIDSGATQIEINIGKDARDIRVADNGSGMSPDDATLAFQRHATSKLSQASDLESLSTLGFRGEALPSIASISKFTCLTKTKEAETGTKIEVKDADIVAVETGCAKGTIMEVRELFHNVPARLKFLKRPQTEFGHIQEIIQSLAICYPAVAFDLKSNNVSKLKTSGSGDLSKVVTEIKLVKASSDLCEVNLDDTVISVAVKGYVARPTHFRGDRKAILTSVNGRPVRCPLTLKALDYAYSDLIPRGKYPIAVINIELPQEQIDVNIHPTKKEIKYSNSHNVYTTIHRAIGSALREPRKELIEALNRAPENQSSIEQENTTQSFQKREDILDYQTQTQTSGYPTKSERHLIRETAEWNIELPEESKVSAEAFGASIQSTKQSTTQLSFQENLEYKPDTTVSTIATVSSEPSILMIDEEISLPAGWRLAGYLHNTYYMFETPEGIELIEQHIAHERYLYEKILASQETPGRTSEHNQRLLISTPLDLTPSQVELLKSNLEPLQSLGFEFDMEEGEEICCTQVPMQLAHKNYANIIQSMVADLEESETANIALDATKSLACQAAIKNGMTLSKGDILSLVSAWLKTERNDTCPHGRPIRLKFSKNKLFEMFHPA